MQLEIREGHAKAVSNPQGQFGPEYECVKEIGRGGYGYVYLFARRGESPGYAAGKFVYQDVFGPSGDVTGNAAYERSFEGLQNFRSVISESQYLLRIFDVRQRHEDGYFCYLMELADDIESGRKINPTAYKPRTLKNELECARQRQRLPARRCVEIAILLARGLQILHESGFTHRDFRPSNIIFVNNVPKLADIDLLAGNDLTVPSYIPKDYAAPEGSHSTRADVFSFGKTLYEMVTGLAVKAYPCLPRDVRLWEDHRVVLKLNKVIARASALGLRERYESAEQMLNDLEEIRTGMNS